MVDRFLRYFTFVILVFANVIEISNAQNINRSKFREVVYSTLLDRYLTRDEAVAVTPMQSPFVMSLNGYWKISSQTNGTSIVKIPGIWSQNANNHKYNLTYRDSESLDVLKNIEQCTIEREFELTQEWLDRETFIEINTTGAVGITLTINGSKVDYAVDSKEFVRFDITGFVREGINSIKIALDRYSVGTFLSSGRYVTSPAAQIGDINLTSAPKFRIEDFELVTRYDSTGRNGLFELKMIVANGRNFAETGTIYYDLMNSKGELIRYNYRDVTISGLGRDTLVFEGRIDKVEKWSGVNPVTYKLMMRIKKDGDFTEYIPFEFGFRTLNYENKTLEINGVRTSIKALDYGYNNLSKKDLISKIAQAKKQGYNIFLLTIPQTPMFYEICTQKGMYVIDAVDISPVIDDEIKNIANAPELLKYFYERCLNTYLRNRNYSCVIGWSLGNSEFNGYNYKKSYLYFKNELDSVRPIVFKGAAGKWNNDEIN